MGLLDGQVVFVTGGARAQGRAHAVVSAREGADVAIVDVSSNVVEVPYPLATAEDMRETVRLVEALGRRIVAVEADVREQSQLDAAVDRTLDELGRIDALVANAGIWSQADFWEMSEQLWHEMLDVNLAGVWRSAKAVAPHMIDRRSGSIVMTSSVNGIEPGKTYAHYSASKFGVVGLMKTVAAELAPHGVRCNSVHPGAVMSGMVDHQPARDRYAGHPGGTMDDVLAAGRRYGALRGTTFMDPENIANAALYLNSALASHVTGTELVIDAGHLLMPGVNSDPVLDD
jgi:SDR family mycofactocin-dependent oxidoreductase